jgi:hypothetical protein
VEGSDHREGELGLTRTGTDSHLGVLASLAIQLAPHPDKLLIACHDPNPLHRGGKRDGTINRDEAARRGKIIREAKRLAEEAMAPAWTEWFESKRGADPARRNSERRAVLPVHDPKSCSESEAKSEPNARPLVLAIGNDASVLRSLRFRYSSQAEFADGYARKPLFDLQSGHELPL